jgi:chromosome segregation ATPase
MGILTDTQRGLADNKTESARLEQKRRELMKAQAALLAGLGEFDARPAAALKAHEEAIGAVNDRLEELQRKRGEIQAEIRRLQIARRQDWQALDESEERWAWSFGLDLKTLVIELDRLGEHQRALPSEVWRAWNLLSLWVRQVSSMRAHIERERAAILADGGEPAADFELALARTPGIAITANR